MFERRGPFAEVQEVVRGGGFDIEDRIRRVHLPKHHQGVGLPKRKGSQEQRVHDAEHGGIPCDGEPERQNREDAHDWRLGERAKTEPDVLQ